MSMKRKPPVEAVKELHHPNLYNKHSQFLYKASSLACSEGESLKVLIPICIYLRANSFHKYFWVEIVDVFP
jgi:hypothetical protein